MGDVDIIKVSIAPHRSASTARTSEMWMSSFGRMSTSGHPEGDGVVDSVDSKTKIFVFLAYRFQMKSAFIYELLFINCELSN